MSERPVNFSAGPAILPLEVLEEASRAVFALDDVGLSILEISHRSPPFEAIIEAARDGVRRATSWAEDAVLLGVLWLLALLRIAPPRSWVEHGGPASSAMTAPTRMRCSH